MRLCVFSEYSFSEGLNFDLIAVDFWGEINLFILKVISVLDRAASLPNISSDIKSKLQALVPSIFRTSPFRTDVMRYIFQFDFEKYHAIEDTAENYEKLFRIWDHPNLPDSFLKFYLKNHGTKAPEINFAFLDYLPIFCARVSDVGKVDQPPRYRNPHQRYFNDLNKSKDLKFIFKSVLNIHNHFPAYKKLRFETLIEEIAEKYKFDQMVNAYSHASEQQWFFLQIDDDLQRKEILEHFIQKDPGLRLRLGICLKLAGIVYGSENKKSMTRMAKAYDLLLRPFLKTMTRSFQGLI